MGVGMKTVIAIYIFMSLILLSGFYFPPAWSMATTPIYIIWHSGLVYFILWFFTVTPFLILISSLFYPSLQGRIYKLFPYAFPAPVVIGVFYLLIAYGLWKKKGLAWTVALVSAFLCLPADFLCMIMISIGYPAARFLWPFYMLGLIFNVFIVHQLVQQEVRELYGNPLKKLKDTIFKRPR